MILIERNRLAGQSVNSLHECPIVCVSGWLESGSMHGWLMFPLGNFTFSFKCSVPIPLVPFITLTVYHLKWVPA